MPIVGFNFDKLSVERKAPLQKGMKATHNITIDDIKEEPLNLGEKTKKQGLKFSFEYIVDYQPKIGEVLIKGHILYLDDEKKIKEDGCGYHSTFNQHGDNKIHDKSINFSSGFEFASSSTYSNSC